MHKFVRNLVTEWRKLGLPFADEKILVAVSGGADSVSLALALHRLRELKKLKLEFAIAHFNHDLRGAESEADEEFVKNLAEKLGFGFVSGKPEKKLQNQTGNLEQLARIARYDFLAETAAKTNTPLILTAHTLNDQAETFLFNLLRGSGTAGLSGMKRRRNFESEVWSPDSEKDLESIEKSEIRNSKSKIELVRPFLSWAKREDTETFCRENNINFRQDAMNTDLKFARVRIRRELIPLLRTFNPKIVETLAKTADLLRNETESSIAESFENGESLAVRELKNLSKAMRMRKLRAWLKHHRGDLRRIESSHLEAVESLIFSSKSGRVAELPNGGKVIKNRGNLSFETNEVEKS